MEHIDTLVACIDATEHSAFLVEKALKLRDHAGAKLHYVQPIYDDVVDDAHLGFSDEEHREIIDLMTAAERIKFDHLISSNANDSEWSTSIRWAKQSWRAILDAAQDVGADLVLKDAYIETRLGEVVHTPHDWNLLRHAELPVMMLKPKQWVPNANVVAAVDIFDARRHPLNDHILSYAASLAMLLEGRLHVVNVMPDIKEAVLERGRFGKYQQMRSEVIEKRREYLWRLTECSGVACEDIHVLEGDASQLIDDLVDRLDAEITVIGKVRPGMAQFLGTTAEQLLHSVNSDVVSVT